MISDADLYAAVQDIDCPERGGQGCDDFCDHGSCSHTYLRELRAVVRLAGERAAHICDNAATIHFAETMRANDKSRTAQNIAAEIRRALVEDADGK